jgi:hypothetical protein
MQVHDLFSASVQHKVNFRHELIYGRFIECTILYNSNPLVALKDKISQKDILKDLSDLQNLLILYVQCNAVAI